MKSHLDYSSSQKLKSHKDIRVEFTGRNLTKFGGIQLMRKFLRLLKVEKEFESAVTIEKRESKFSVAEMLVSLLYAVILDIRRQSDTLMLRLDKSFQKIAGLDDYPVQSTISRFLKSFRVETAKGIANVNHSLLMKARRDFEGWHKITLDLDSHVRTAYGHQQRASVGYNPKKPGRPSFHPLFCFIGETRDFLHGIFRTGKAHSCRGVKRFVDECLKKIPEGIREIFLRADSGFYDGDFLNYLEMRRVLYAIVVKLYPWIQIELVGLKYRDIGGGLSVAEMQYRGLGWKEPRRMVVIREEQRNQRAKKQLTLLELMGYSYQVIVTNIEDMLPEEVWRFYNGRANVENMIKEGILSYSLDVNISHFYGANVAHFHLVMLAYNLMNLFKELVLGQKDKKRMGKWIRQRFLLIAGRLISSGRKFILKLQEDWAYREEYKKAEERLERLAWVT
ncbi:MAG: IS1380 family transposase [Thermodesulfobacteriota bacterium]